MSTVIIAVISVTVIGIACAAVLAFASKVMAVEEDERVGLIREALPGANCGACGFAGCDGYASGLIEGDGVKTNLCVPGGDAVSRQISEILGTEFEDVVEQIAVVHCCADCNTRKSKMEYSGITTCKAARELHGGQNACTYGCLGFGDCAGACPSGAICIEDGLARVDTRLCTGCGMCAKTCPNGVISIKGDTITTVVMCSNEEKGAVVRQKCPSGCIACQKCVRECPVSAIEVRGNLARIDYEKCTGCGKCAEVCVAKCIKKAKFSGVYNT